MKEELIRTWQQKTVYIIALVHCTMGLYQATYTELQNCSFHPALYSLMQKAVLTNTCFTFRILLTEL